MIKVVAKGYFHENQVEKAIELYRELVEETRKEEGCIRYELFQDVKDATILTVIEEWENREVLDFHMKTEHFTRIVPQLSNLRYKDSELNIYQLAI